ncbi:hypothetical protein [Accumulibacter sp.]|uniref:hypothetical protein n=1 Tax=Accumulibacter sp. TaxID=2053492 RepID=UPI00342C40FA
MLEPENRCLWTIEGPCSPSSSSGRIAARRRTRSTLARAAVIAQPARERRFVDPTGRNGKHGQRRIGRVRDQTPAIECRKQAKRQESHPFVAIDEGAVFFARPTP